MIEWLESIDREIVLAVNGMHSPFLDELMWLISGRLTWIPLYLYLFFIVLKEIGSKKAIVFLVFVLLSVAFSDLISVHLFKNVFLRYRPSHNLLIMDQLHFYQEAPGKFYRGGEYGFISSHAANIFAIITVQKQPSNHEYSVVLHRFYIVQADQMICGVIFLNK